MFLHYAFDEWMAREYPGVCFERYCDDIIVEVVPFAVEVGGGGRGVMVTR
jgi:hypothetical protein